MGVDKPRASEPLLSEYERLQAESVQDGLCDLASLLAMGYPEPCLQAIFYTYYIAFLGALAWALAEPELAGAVLKALENNQLLHDDGSPASLRRRDKILDATELGKRNTVEELNERFRWALDIDDEGE